MTIILFTSCLQSQAQLPDYYVYLISGKVTIEQNGKKPIVIKQNQLIYKKDVIVVKKGGEITLVDKDASFLVLNAAGVYNDSSLLKNAAKKINEGITRKYLKLIFHELLDPNHDFEKFKKENIAGVWGGVSRTDGCGNKIFPVKGLKTSASSIVFKWYNTSLSSNYLFVIYDRAGNELTKMNVRDTLLHVNITETLKGKPGKYLWRITSVDGKCEDEVPANFEILTVENENAITAQILTATGNQSLEMKLEQIARLESNGFVIAAAVFYSGVVKANMDNIALRKSYVSFLLEYGFDEAAIAAWK